MQFCSFFLHIALDIIITITFQGDRGFDGLPGLPGNKGHRVSWSCHTSYGRCLFAYYGLDNGCDTVYSKKHLLDGALH